MNDEVAFLRSILADPDDSARRLLYADWLDERGHPAAELLRLDAELDRQTGNQATRTRLQKRREAVLDSLDPASAAFLTTLGRPFRIGPQSREFFDCEPARLPFSETIGFRGRAIAFESQFRGERPWDPGLVEDLKTLCGQDWGTCAGGAGTIRKHPFLCELPPGRKKLTGEDVLKALKARDFRSRHIKNLKAHRIPFPGYHPGGSAEGIENDEIHNDLSKQYLFGRGFEGELDADEPDGPDRAHAALQRAVVDGQVWYVLLHTVPERHAEFLFSDYVVLFGVGRSLRGDRLIGAVTHQLCHNLCD